MALCLLVSITMMSVPAVGDEYVLGISLLTYVGDTLLWESMLLWLKSDYIGSYLGQKEVKKKKKLYGPQGTGGSIPGCEFHLQGRNLEVCGDS